jgi:hypothetical protein
MIRDSVKQILGIDKEALEEKYLGLPTAIGRSSKEAFEPIPRKIYGLWVDGGRSYSTMLRGKLYKNCSSGDTHLFNELFPSCPGYLQENHFRCGELLVGKLC